MASEAKKSYIAKVSVTAFADIHLDAPDDVFEASSEQEAKAIAIEIADDEFDTGDFRDLQYDVFLQEWSPQKGDSE